MQTLAGIAAGSTDLGTFTGTTISPNATIRSALQELVTGIAARQVVSDDQTAAEVAFTPAGSISSTDVQAAIEELDGEKLALAGGTMLGNIDMGTNRIAGAGNITGGTVTANTIVKSGGLASQFLKADGSVDASTYLQGNQTVAFASTGDVTGAASGATSLAPALTIATGAVSSAKIADNAVSSAKIADGTIVNADVAASAAIEGTKISPNFGAQAVATTGSVSAGSAAVTGSIAVGGTVDGRDVALDGTSQDAMQTLTGVAAGSTGLGTFTGGVISPNATVKSALQELATGIAAPPSMSYKQGYLGADMDLQSNAWSAGLMSVTLEPGVWMVTSSVVVKAQHTAGVPVEWDAQVALGATLNTAFTSGRNSVYAENAPESYTTVSLSSIFSVSVQTDVSLFVKASIDADVAGMLPATNNSIMATTINAVRIQ
jgi:hypothetical protein